MTSRLLEFWPVLVYVGAVAFALALVWLLEVIDARVNPGGV